MSPSQDLDWLCPPVNSWGLGGAGNEGHREIRQHQGHHNVQRKERDPSQRENSLHAVSAVDIVLRLFALSVVIFWRFVKHQASNGSVEIIIHLPSTIPVPSCSTNNICHKRDSRRLELCSSSWLSWFGISCYRLGTSYRNSWDSEHFIKTF